jgi:hypothetical protein
VPIAQTFAAINDLHKTQYLWLALLMVWDVKQYCKGLQVSKNLWGSIKIGATSGTRTELNRSLLKIRLHWFLSNSQPVAEMLPTQVGTTSRNSFTLCRITST